MMAFSHAEWLLIGTVAAVGVLHTIVPDHWVPITLIARQRGWDRGQTTRAALLAGTGHVLSTLLIAVIVWVAGVAAAKSFGNWISTLTSIALVGFGLWIAVSSLLAMRKGESHGHSHDHHAHGHRHGHGFLSRLKGGVHGPELQEVETQAGTVGLSIYEDGMPPHFRATGRFDTIGVTTIRPDGARQTFTFEESTGFWQSVDEIPEPHGFAVQIELGRAGEQRTYMVEFAEHEHGDHSHGDDQGTGKTSSRTALLLILGSSPMVEGIPAFFAAGRYGVSLILAMSLVFGVATILTYVVLCVGSTASLKRVSFGPLERYGEVISGAFIALVGLVFWIWPVL